MLAKLFGSAVHGVDAFRITVEVSVSNGIGYQITGLPDDAIRESLSRIAVALKNSGFHMPRNKLVINLAPADVRKTGTAFDLPITIGILLASGQLEMNDGLKDITLIGEIGLDGTIYPVRGALCMTFRAQRDGFKGIVLPMVNEREASLVKGVSVFGIKHFTELIALIQDGFQDRPARAAFFLKKKKNL
jgi:magnesium chelatase family protein